MIRSRLAAVVLAAVLAACGGKSSSPPTAPEPPPTATEANAAASADATADPAPAPADGAAATAAPAGPQPTDAEIATAVEKSLGFVEDLAKSAAANKGNCGAMADSFQKLVDGNGALLTQIREYGADPVIGPKAQAEMQKSMPRWNAAMQTLQDSVAGCEADPKLQKVFQQLQT